jgi:hypothetical protein
VSTEDDYRSDRDRYRQPLRRALDLSHHDPVVRFTADQDGDYRVGLRDLNGSSLDDPRFAYRLVIEQQRPDFHLVAWSQRQATDDDKKIDRQSLVIPRAGTLPVLIDVLRQGGFDQPVRITAHQLPPGVTAGECEVAAGQTEAVLTLTASDQSDGWCGPIQIVGEAEIDGRTERRVACEAVLTGNTDNVEQQRPAARLARQIVLAVVDRQPAPAQVMVGSADANASPIVETSIGAKLAIPLRLAKHGELKSELALVALGLPEKIKASEVKFAPDATDAQLQLTLDAADIPAGNYCVFLRGIAKSTFARNPDAIARAQARRTAFNDVIAQLDRQVQQAADQLARAQQNVAQRTALVSKLQSVPQSIQPTLQAATEQVAQIQAQLSALPSAADLSSAKATPSAAVADDSNLLALFEEVTQSLDRSTSEAMAQLQKAGAGVGQMNELFAVAESQLQAAQAAVAQTEASHEQATAKRRRADEFVKQLDQQLAEAQKNFGPSELASYVHSPSFTLKVARSPLTSTLPSEPIKLRPGETREVPVTIRRRFDFADTVQVTLQAPDGSSQIVAEPRRIERGRDSNTLQVTAGSDAPPGEHTLSVVLKLKFNGVEVQDQVPLKVVVAQP